MLHLWCAMLRCTVACTCKLQLDSGQRLVYRIVRADFEAAMDACCQVLCCALCRVCLR